MFAIQEFLWGLPADVREAAFRNNAKFVAHLLAKGVEAGCAALDYEVRTFHSAIDCAFWWQRTPEGSAYWDDLIGGLGSSTKKSYYEIGKLYEMSKAEAGGKYFKPERYELENDPRAGLICGTICDEYGEPCFDSTREPYSCSFWLTGSSRKGCPESVFRSALHLLPAIVTPKERVVYAWKKPDVSQRALILD